MKKLAKRMVAAVLGYQVRKLQAKNDFKVVAVAGSVGKTSTKLAIAQVLSTKFKVRYQNGNYNDLVSVPLIFFGETLPNLFNPLAWLGVFWRNQRQLKRRFPYEVVVVEVGTDKPGDIEEFKAYLKADLGVLTAVTPEHMLLFKDMAAVAREEFGLADLAAKLIINADMIEPKYHRDRRVDATYALSQAADLQLTNLKFDGLNSSFDVLWRGKHLLKAEHEAIAEPRLYSAAAAIAVAAELGLTPAQIKAGLDLIKPVNGRMQQLAGVKHSTIIDDTYNASPEAMKAALATLYRLPAKQKIAILGNMNELGDYSKQAHEEIGRLCLPDELDQLVTIGADANDYLATAAEAKGCKVNRFDDPVAAGEYLKEVIKDGGLILAKGSQNGVFAEEAIKPLLANAADRKKLVRQTPAWLKIKSKQFNRQLA